MKTLKTLKTKSGISLIFVLGIMLLLLALGVSALTAAGLSHGAHFARQDRNRLSLYVNSMERAIVASLPIENGDFGEWLFLDVLEQAFEGQAFEGEPIEIEINLTSTEITLPTPVSATYAVRITGQMQVVLSMRYSRAVFTENPHTLESPATPLSADISGIITIELTTTISTTISTTTSTTYRYSNGHFREDGEDGEGFNIEKEEPPEFVARDIYRMGVWEVISREQN